LRWVAEQLQVEIDCALTDAAELKTLVERLQAMAAVDVPLGVDGATGVVFMGIEGMLVPAVFVAVTLQA
jgi:transcriptional regulator of aromatic amino acid metabolism